MLCIHSIRLAEGGTNHSTTLDRILTFMQAKVPFSKKFSADIEPGIHRYMCPHGKKNKKRRRSFELIHSNYGVSLGASLRLCVTPPPPILRELGQKNGFCSFLFSFFLFLGRPLFLSYLEPNRRSKVIIIEIFYRDTRKKSYPSAIGSLSLPRIAKTLGGRVIENRTVVSFGSSRLQARQNRKRERFHRVYTMDGDESGKDK
jgi:hypothetical protein